MIPYKKIRRHSSDIHVLILDKRHWLDLQPADGRISVSKIALASGAVAAINGSTFGPTGPGYGELWDEGQPRKGYSKPHTTAIYSKDQDLSIRMVQPGERLDATTFWALMGNPGLVASGKVRVTVAEDGTSTNIAEGYAPRTALGVTPKGDILLVVVDGRTSASRGMTLDQLAETMVYLGCREAMNLDGGGSSTMWMAGQGVVNRPSEGKERAVANALLVYLIEKEKKPQRGDTVRICIDPGHGGKDPGAIGPTGLREKDVNLAIATELEGELLRHGLQVTMTRTIDREVNPLAKTKEQELQARCDIANQVQADYFVSVHCNSFTDPTVGGTEIWVLAPGGEAERLAKTVLPEVVAAQGVNDRGVKSKALYVLKHTEMPAILVENCFISNTKEEKLLADPTFQVETARAIARGVLRYLGIEYLPPPVMDPETGNVIENLRGEKQRLQNTVEQLTIQLQQVVSENNVLRGKLNQIHSISRLEV